MRDIVGRVETFVIGEKEAGERLDRVLVTRFPEQSRTYFQGLIDQGLVTLGGKRPKKRMGGRIGEVVEVTFAMNREIRLEAEDIALDVLFEDEHLLVINKPAGMVVHPGAGNWSGTVANALLFHCKALENNGIRPGIVHRLDKDTSGVLLAAKSETVQRQLMEQFAERQVEKRYLAFCHGNPGVRRIEAPIGRDPRQRKRMAVVEGGKEAVTEVRPLRVEETVTLVECRPISGRTHQIRVHLKSVGCPIVGDQVYGRGEGRMMLHAAEISFTHPVTGDRMQVKSCDSLFNE
jgi:23S rRNA pseudouridine1911/1915/1917 synthase